MYEDMSSDNPGSREPDDDGTDEGIEVPIEIEPSDDLSPRKRLGKEADRAVEQFDEGVVDLLAWMLDTETRSRIYVYLRKHPGSTSEEIAKGTGLYPSTVREALAKLHGEEKVTRTKRESKGAGNNPYEYEAIPPSKLVGGMVQQVQDELNTLFHLDRYLSDEEPTSETEPITITVEDTQTGSAKEGQSVDRSDGENDDPTEAETTDSPSEENETGTLEDTNKDDPDMK